MEATIFLVQFWGWFFVIESLIYLFRLKVFLERLGDRAFVTLDGYLSFTLGLVTIILHNIWVADWRVIITVLGWLFLLRGVVRISFPETIYKMTPKLTSKPALVRIMLAALVFLGALLIWLSW